MLLFLPAPASAQSGANVLLVVNERSPDSAPIADHYARARGVPGDQVLRLATEPADEIDRLVFEQQIQAPITEWLAKHSAHDRILFIVLTKGIPLRIRGTSGRDGTLASVDSELTLLYRRLTGVPTAVMGPSVNPYFLGEAGLGQAKRFTHEAHDIFLVTRLDGFAVPDVLGLIDRGAAPSAAGRILLDQRATLDETGGNRWLRDAATWLQANGLADRVHLETSSRVLTDQKDVLGYFSWGSNDPAITVRRFNFGFVPGALAGMFVSTDGRTFREPPAAWTVGPWSDRTRFFAGSPQSLAGDLIREGVTGMAAYVAEPYLDGTVRPNVLFPAYVSGMNLAESFYLAMPYLGWRTVVVGDPLCAPFRKNPAPPGDLDPGLDPATELPALFSTRRQKALEAQGARREAARLILRSESRAAKGDQAGERQALEEATALDPTYRPAHLLLAGAYDRARDYDKAIERYRHLLTLNSRDAVVLNNLAYALAVHKQQPGEALGLAERALALAPNSAPVMDTLAWVQHLLGKNAEASKLLAKAVAVAPANAEMRLHAAVVYAAVGMLEEAKKELEEAIRLDAQVAVREEAKAVRSAIK